MLVQAVHGKPDRSSTPSPVMTRPIPLALAAALALIAIGIVVLAQDDDPATDPTIDPTTGPSADPTTGPSAEAESDRDQSSEGVAASLDRVIDGDSLELLIDGEPVEVRLLSVNAPELYTLDDAESCNGSAARDHLEGLIEAAGSLRFIAGEEDRFGRQLGDLLVDGRSVTAMMVADGWALALWSGENPDRTEAMMAAAAAKVGMWGDRCGIADSSDLAIVDWQMDPPGRDDENMTDEWVAIANEGSESIDLDGWMIRDETTTNRYRIDGYVLAAGDELRFRSGSGSISGGDYYLNSRFPVWSNRGETVLLVDPQGRVAAHAFVPG
jgi:endonuclease YncB( thermonuclease family)